MSSFIGFVVCLLILGGAVHLHLEKDRAAASALLSDAQRRIVLAKDAVAERQLYLDTLKRHYDLQRRIYDSNHVLLEAQTVMNELLAEVQTQKLAYQRIVDNRRQSAKDRKIEFLELTDGRVLRDAKIINFDDTTLSVLCSDGILKVNAQDLPVHLQEFFRLDLIEPGHALAVNADGSSGSPSTSDASSSRSSSGFRYTAPTLAPSEGQTAYSDSLKTVADTIKQLTQRIQILERSKHAPLMGIDAHIPVNSSAHKFRKKTRNDKIDVEIAILKARRRIFESQQRQLANVSRR